MNQRSLNEVYSKSSMRRRYEVWFLKLMLADGSGAWWFRYLLLNLGRSGSSGCPNNSRGMPVQVWATWFPKDGKPQGFIQGLPSEQLSLSAPNTQPFSLRAGDNRLGEDACAGRVAADGQVITWDLRYRSTVGVTMSDVGWIGFSRTPHSDAVFSGEITFDGRSFRGEPLGYGLQGHNCGYRHRNRWNWAHCVALDAARGLSTFEALEYEIGLGLRFRRALFWHEGKLYTFKKFSDVSRDPERLRWGFKCSSPREGLILTVDLDGGGPSLHRLPYLKTDCSGSFEVANNSLAQATLHLSRRGQSPERITASGGAVLEMGGV